MKHIKKESDGTAGSRNHGTVREGAAYLVFGVLTTLIDYVISNGLLSGSYGPGACPVHCLGGGSALCLCDQ